MKNKLKLTKAKKRLLKYGMAVLNDHENGKT